MLKKFIMLTLCSLTPLMADNLPTKYKMINLLESIRADFENGYAPMEWKKEYLNWDLNEQFEIAKNQILATENITTTQYQQILKGFFLSPRDYHVGIQFFSTESAELPISVRSVDNRLFIVYVNNDKINPSLFPIYAGEEIVTINGQPAMDALIDFQKHAFHSCEEGTDRALAQLFFTNRFASRGHVIPSGPVTLELKSGCCDAVRSVQLCWEYTPEMITSNVSHQVEETKRKLPDYLFTAFDNETHDSCHLNNNPFDRGSKKSYLPSLGKKIWQSSDFHFFDAYIYQTPDRGLVGYIRLPTYHPFFPEFFFEEFKEVISHFQDTTDALVIDQTNNPGGSLLYLYALASLLTDKPLLTPKHKFTINQEHVFEAAGTLKVLEDVHNDEDARRLFGESFHGYPISYQFVQILMNYYRFVIDEWKAGRTLTQPHYLFGVDRINPHSSVNYTKPILLLIDELDISGGDFFPAIMQDNQRALVMGTRTSGAGGYVRNREISNIFGVMMYRFTESMALRENQECLENLGVKPDIEYKWTVNDVQGGFEDYANAINEVVNAMIKEE